MLVRPVHSNHSRSWSQEVGVRLGWHQCDIANGGQRELARVREAVISKAMLQHIDPTARIVSELLQVCSRRVCLHKRNKHPPLRVNIDRAKACLVTSRQDILFE